MASEVGSTIPVSRVGPLLPRDTLIELGQFALNVDLLSTREDVLKRSIELTLLRETERALNAEELAGAMSRMLRLDKPFKARALSALAGSLIEEDRLLLDDSAEPPRYFLTEDAATEWQERRKVVGDLHLEVCDRFMTRIEQECGPLSVGQEKKIAEGVYETFGRLFAVYGYQAAALALRDEGEVGGIGALADLPQIVMESTRDLDDQDLRTTVRLAITDMLQSPTDEEGEFISLLAHTYLVVAIINADPELQRVSSQVLQRFILLLDTSIILPLLLAEDLYHEETERLVMLGRSLGMKFKVSRRTIEELRFTMRRSDIRIKRVPSLPKELYPKIAELTDDDFIRAYWLALRDKPGLKWEAMLEVWRRMDEFLFKVYGIETCDLSRYMENVTEDELIGCTIAVMEAWDRAHRKPKAEVLAEHDAYHYLLVKEIMGLPPDERPAQQILFLTADKTLAQVPSELGERDDVPSLLYPPTLLLMLLPFSAPEVASEESVKLLPRLLSSLHLSTAAGTVDFDEVAPVLRPWMVREELSDEAIIEITTSTYAREVIRRQEEFQARGLEFPVQEIDEAMLDALEERMRRVRSEDARREMETFRLEKELELAATRADYKRAIRNSYVFLGLFLLTLLSLVAMIVSNRW